FCTYVKLYTSYLLYTLVIYITLCLLTLSFFFFNDTATTEIYTLSLHDALPISGHRGSASLLQRIRHGPTIGPPRAYAARCGEDQDRKSTRLNSSHVAISYAVFCLKKKKKK